MIMPSGERVSREKAMADPGRVGRGEPDSDPSPRRASRSASGSRCDGAAYRVGVESRLPGSAVAWSVR
jgi:hypothetical protein